MISAVLDTNILVSGTVTALTPPGQILNAWLGGQFELVISAHILDEVERTLQKPYFRKNLTPQITSDFVDLLQNEATIAPITIEIHGVATHPEDDLILATAISANADYLVTGDGSLLAKVGNSYHGVVLVTPGDFLKILQGLQ